VALLFFDKSDRGANASKEGIMTRSLRWMPVLLVLVLLPLTALGQSTERMFKVGLLMPYTGVFAVVGQDATRGVELSLNKIGTLGGLKIQILKEDEETKPDVALIKARKLVESDKVDVLVGPVSAQVAMAIRNYIHERGIPLIVPVAGVSQLTAPPMASPWIFRITDTNDMSNFSMGTWVFKKTPYRKVVIMASDFVAGHASVGAFMAAFKAAGGEIVKEIYIPLNTADFAPYLAQIAGLKADAVYAWFAGADAIRFVKGYKEYGLATKFPLLGYNSLVDDIILPALGDAAVGITSVGHYSAALDTPENRIFVREYEAKYNARPTRYSEQGFVAGQLIVATLEELKGEASDRVKLQDALRRTVAKIHPPRGPIQFDRYQQVITNIYVMKVEKQGGQLVNTIVDRIPNVSQEVTWKWWNK